MTIHGTKIWGILFLALSLTVGLPNLSFAGYADDLTPEQFEKFTKDQKDMGNISQSTETQKDVNLDAMYGDGIGAWFGKTFYKGVAGIACRCGLLSYFERNRLDRRTVKRPAFICIF